MSLCVFIFGSHLAIDKIVLKRVKRNWVASRISSISLYSRTLLYQINSITLLLLLHANFWTGEQRAKIASREVGIEKSSNTRSKTIRKQKYVHFEDLILNNQFV